jgi:hypothetical protein
MWKFNVLAAILSLSTVGRAQDAEVPREGAEPEKEKAAAPAPRDVVLNAVRKLEVKEELVVRTRVTRQEANNPMAGMGNVVIGGAGGGTPSKPFTGEIEVWRAKDGTLVLMSKKKLPGFALYLQGETAIAETVVEDEQIDLATIKNELGSLLELDRLLLWMKKAEWKKDATDELTGEVTYTAQLSKRLVRRGDGGGGGPVMFMGRAKVLRVEARLTMSRDGMLRDARFRVVRNDPMQKMMKLMIRQGGGPGGPGFAPPMPPQGGGDDDDDKAEGSSSTYALTFEAGRPSERAKAFKGKITKILAEEEDE